MKKKYWSIKFLPHLLIFSGFLILNGCKDDFSGSQNDVKSAFSGNIVDRPVVNAAATINGKNQNHTKTLGASKRNKTSFSRIRARQKSQRVSMNDAERATSENIVDRTSVNANAMNYYKKYNPIKTVSTDKNNSTYYSRNRAGRSNYPLTIDDVETTYSGNIVDSSVVDTTEIYDDNPIKMAATDNNNAKYYSSNGAGRRNAPLTTDDVESEFSGNIVDGPIVDATVMIYDKNHNLIKTVSGNDNATYLSRIYTKGKSYPLTIEVEDGFDLVTEMAPDFKLLSVTLKRRQKKTNINPFSTMIVEAARAKSGVLNDESISIARDSVMSELNFGLNPLIIADPISTPITESNVALMTKSSEAMGEMIRRVRDHMISSGVDIDGNDVVAALAADISDGTINGVGANLTNPRISALSKLVSAQVLIESLSNTLKVHGEVATSKLDTAIMYTHPSVSPGQLLGSVTINMEMLEQAREALYAAQVLVPSNDLSLLSDILDSILAGSLPSEIKQILSGDSGKYLASAITYVLSATDEKLELVNNADITQRSSNTIPTISGSSSTIATEDSLYVYQPTAFDADGDTLSFGIINRPAWASFDAASGRLSGTPENGDVGSYSGIEIRVSDGTDSASNGVFGITVNNTNDAPLISGSPMTSVEESSPYSFQPSVSDSDGDLLVFSISGLPSWASFDSSTGLMSGTPGTTDVNTYSNILISVTDSTVSSSLPVFSIVVNATNTDTTSGGSSSTTETKNNTPTISGSPSTIAIEDSLYDYQPTAFDLDGDTLSFGIINRPAWASFDTASGRLSGTPENGDVGIYSGIEISVSDGTDSKSAGAFSITVNNTNDAPLISGLPKTHIDETSSYSFQPSASDPDGDSLVFSISGLPLWASFDINTGLLSGTPSATDANTYSNIQISVRDSSVSSSLPAFSIVVNATNTAPTISGVASSTATEDSHYDYQPTAFDADGDTLSFGIINSPAWASFDSASGRLSGTPENGDVGVYSGIEISVSDGTDSKSVGAFSITVNNTNDAPVISGLPTTHIDETSPYSFQPSASDPDSDPLVFSISGMPAWASFDTNTGLLSGTPGATDANTYSNIQISVSDSTVSSSLPAFSIVVNATNTSPTISGSASSTVAEGSLYDYQPSAFDADGDTLSFGIINRPAWASFDTASGRLSGTPDNGDLGVYSAIEISVSDGTVSESMGGFNITVNSSNSAPVISGSPSASVEENSSYSFQPSSGDPDGDSLVFSITGRPLWASFDSSNGQLSGTPAEGDAGIYSNIVISVSDGSLTTSLPAFSIQAIEVNTDQGSFTLNWTEPTNRVDNTTLYPTEIAGYTISYGTSPGYYPDTIDVDYNAQSLTVTNLPAGTYYVVLVTKDIDGRESTYSQEITVDVL